MTSKIILDTGPLVALIDKGDQFHPWAVKIWQTLTPPLLTCEAVIVESCFLLRKTPGGREAVISLLKSEVISIPFQLAPDINVIGELMQRYQSVPMSLADACLVRMSELIPGSYLLTMDSDFYIYRQNRHQLINLIIPDHHPNAQ